MAPLFCCDSIQPYKATRLDHEDKFRAFMTWAQTTMGTENRGDRDHRDEAGFANANPSYAVQLVQQVNFGRLESKRYFVPVEGQEEVFVEVSEVDLIGANFQKLNTYKNFKCAQHNKFFEVNLYKEDPVNKHHWRANIDRPAGSIDL